MFFSKADSDDVTFLYKLIDGTCPKSYGMKVAAMAGINPSVIAAARKQADYFENVCCLSKYKERKDGGKNKAAEEHKKQAFVKLLTAETREELEELHHELSK